MHLWVEQRELLDAEPVIRGRVTAVDSDAEIAFSDMPRLNNFMLDELAAAGLLDSQAVNETPGA